MRSLSEEVVVCLVVLQDARHQASNAIRNHAAMVWKRGVLGMGICMIASDFNVVLGICAKGVRTYYICAYSFVASNEGQALAA